MTLGRREPGCGGAHRPSTWGPSQGHGAASPGGGKSKAVMMDVSFKGKVDVGRTGWVKRWGGGGRPGGRLRCWVAGGEGALENDVGGSLNNHRVEDGTGWPCERREAQDGLHGVYLKVCSKRGTFSRWNIIRHRKGIRKSGLYPQGTSEGRKSKWKKENCRLRNAGK